MLAMVRCVPSLPGNAAYLALFVVLLIAHLVLGIRYRTWGFLGGVMGGIILEIVGYGARIKMHDNQFVKDPFFA